MERMTYQQLGCKDELHLVDRDHLKLHPESDWECQLTLSFYLQGGEKKARYSNWTRTLLSLGIIGEMAMQD
jgi:hypothetical protein